MKYRGYIAARRLTRRHSLKRLAVASCLAAVWSAASISPSPAAAAVTLGQVAPTPDATCVSSVDVAQPTVTSGNGYVVPGTGTITSWSHNARSGAGQMLTFKVFRKVADPATYMVVGHDGPRLLVQSTLNGFPTSIPVKPGDILGLNTDGGEGCIFVASGESYLLRGGNMADGEVQAFGPGVGARVNVSAVFVPSNSFTLGGIQRSKKKGTATLTVDVPNPGVLVVSGNGVKSAGAIVALSVPTAGTAKLLIRAKGKKKMKLNETGKVKLKPTITYTPTGGDPSAQSRKLKLKKR